MSYANPACTPEESRIEAGRKAARTRAQRTGEHLHVSDPAEDDLYEKCAGPERKYAKDHEEVPPPVTAGYRPSPAAGAGADTCTPEERNKERARKAARTRAERYGQELHKADPAQDDLLYKCGDPEELAELEGEEDEE